ncbi:MAG: sulfatase [Planctomycetes bacterium]|nr:sulfatase [Planctomycetota bacterium]
MKLPLHALLALGLTAAASSCTGGGDARPNVLLVTLDTTRPDFFGSWGAAGDLTPNLDRLAAEGTRFAMAVSASAVTPVSHASILTGRVPYEHGLRVLAARSGFTLPRDVPTLATTLKAKGYATAAYHSAFPVSRVYGFERGFDVYEDLSNVALESKQGARVGWDVTQGQRRSDQTSDMVLDFLAKTQEPFFLWIHYWDPHDMTLVPDKSFLSGPRAVKSPEGTLAYWREMYGLELSFVDHEFGRVLDALRADGRLDRTLVAVIADHGEGLDDGMARHDWGAHRILYQEQVHVPLIVRVPGAPQGVVVDQLVRSIDVLPTLLDYLDVAPEGEVQGRSLRPLMEGRPDEPRIAYADQINLFDDNAGMVDHRPKADLLHMAMDERYKLIYRPSYPEQSELYDYRADPGEQRDLFDDPAHHADRVRLLEDLARRAPWVLQPFPPGGDAEMSAEARAALEKLGYAGGESAEGQHWSWLCPEHWLAAEHEKPGPCPECGRPCVPRRLLPETAPEDEPPR